MFKFDTLCHKATKLVLENEGLPVEPPVKKPLDPNGDLGRVIYHFLSLKKATNDFTNVDLTNPELQNVFNEVKKDRDKLYRYFKEFQGKLQLFMKNARFKRSRPDKPTISGRSPKFLIWYLFNAIINDDQQKIKSEMEKYWSDPSHIKYMMVVAADEFPEMFDQFASNKEKAQYKVKSPEEQEASDRRLAQIKAIYDRMKNRPTQNSEPVAKV